MQEESERIAMPIVLTIAGTDSGGGAGVMADLKTFAALGVHGCVVVSCLTAQNPARVLEVSPCSPEFVEAQLKAVFTELSPKVVKTGMLYDEKIIQKTASFLKKTSVCLVVDPVMISTSGAKLLREEAIEVMKRELFPLATLVTPNLDELASLLGHPILNELELRSGAKEFYELYKCPVLAKGGHLKGSHLALDILWDGIHEYSYSLPFVRDVSTHGTGCTFSAAITAFLACGFTLSEAVGRAKCYVNEAIRGSVRISRYYALDWFGFKK